MKLERIIFARFSVRTIGYEVKKFDRGMKSIINLSTTRNVEPKKYFAYYRKGYTDEMSDQRRLILTLYQRESNQLDWYRNQVYQHETESLFCD